MVKVSVLMPNYNGAKYLKEAVNSILGQIFEDFELIIVNFNNKNIFKVSLY